MAGGPAQRVPWSFCASVSPTPVGTSVDTPLVESARGGTENSARAPQASAGTLRRFALIHPLGPDRCLLLPVFVCMQ